MANNKVPNYNDRENKRIFVQKDLHKNNYKYGIRFFFHIRATTISMQNRQENLRSTERNTVMDINK